MCNGSSVKPDLLHSNYPTRTFICKLLVRTTEIVQDMDYYIKHCPSAQIGTKSGDSFSGRKGGLIAVFLSTESGFSAQGARI